MNNQTTTGANPIPPFKVFNEQYEIKVRKMVQNNLDKESRVDGEVAYVVKDLDTLILDIMELHDEKK
jgi:hypothetical protein